MREYWLSKSKRGPVANRAPRPVSDPWDLLTPFQLEVYRLFEAIPVVGTSGNRYLVMCHGHLAGNVIAMDPLLVFHYGIFRLTMPGACLCAAPVMFQFEFYVTPNDRMKIALISQVIWLQANEKAFLKKANYHGHKFKSRRRMIKEYIKKNSPKSWDGRG